MSILNNMESLRDELSFTDLKLLDYITENVEEIPLMTSNELAEKTKTSAATVVRFSKKLGFKKYSDFRLSLSKDVKSRLTDDYRTILVDDSFQTIKNKILQNDKMVIESIGDILDEKTIEEVIDMIYNAKKIYVYGVGTSALAAEDIRQKWTRLGKTVIFDKDKYLLQQQLKNDFESCIFVGISHSGKNRDVLTLINQAKDIGVPTIGITQLGLTELSKKVDFIVQTARTENTKKGYYGSGATHSILLQIITIDIIFYFYLRKFL